MGVGDAILWGSVSLSWPVWERLRAGLSLLWLSAAEERRRMSETPLWMPTADRAAAAQVWDLVAEVNRRHGMRVGSYRELHAWSIAHPDLFWSLIWDFCGVTGDKGERLVADPGKMPGARFLPDATLNFAENLLRRADG